jgi:predicted PurR-regulated permease PerM
MRDDGNASDSDSSTILLWQRRLLVVVLAGVLLFLSIQVACYFSDLLRILGISLLLSYLFINVVDYLNRWLRNRVASVVIVYVILLGLLIVAGTLLIPAIVFQVTQLLDATFNHIPDFTAYLLRLLLPLEAKFHAVAIHIDTVDLLYSIASAIPKPDTIAIFSKVTDVAQSTMTGLTYGISIMVVSFYFLLEGDKMKDAVITQCPRKYHRALKNLAKDMDQSLQSFFRGQVVLAVLAGIVMLGVYLLLGVKYALFLSVFLGIWEIVPVIGPPIGFLPTIMSVAVDGIILPGNRWIQLLIVTTVFLILQNIKDNVVAPRYLGNVIKLHPVVILIAIMAGARVDGLIGIIFAIPVACLLNTLFHHLPLKSHKTS